MEEQKGKTWKGTASDLYNRLKEIIGEATGAEPTDEQLASTLWPFGIEITRHKRSGGSPHLKIYARPESARRIAPIAPIAPNAAAAAENVTTDCATTRPIAPGASEGGGGRGRNGRNSTASFRETDESTSPPLATSNATGKHSWAEWGRVPVCVRAVWRGGHQHVVMASGWCRRQPQIVLCGLGQRLHTRPALLRLRDERCTGPSLNCSPVRCIDVAWKSGYGSRGSGPGRLHCCGCGRGRGAGGGAVSALDGRLEYQQAHETLARTGGDGASGRGRCRAAAGIGRPARRSCAEGPARRQFRRGLVVCAPHETPSFDRNAVERRCS